MMFEGNTTYKSEEQDTDGLRYSVSFELFPFSENNEYSLYLGRLNGRAGAKGAKHGQYCVVRALNSCHPRLRHWESFMECHKQAGFLANEYNQIVMNRDAVSFSKPLRAQMYTVWDLKGVLGRLLLFWKPHRKRLEEGEAVVVEEHFKGSNTFVNKEGFVGVNECDTLQAFGHFTWFFTRGQMVVCDLKGVRKDNQYFVTDPTVHSVVIATVDGRLKYGDKDKGQHGIASFFRHHRCNGMCNSFPLPYAC